jgi:hypothetical protein
MKRALCLDLPPKAYPALKLSASWFKPYRRIGPFVIARSNVFRVTRESPLSVFVRPLFRSKYPTTYMRKLRSDGWCLGQR